MWRWPDGSLAALPHPSLVRVLLPSTETDAETVAELVVAGRNQIVLGHCGEASQALELALRNALPGEEVVAIPMQVVVDPADTSKPQAILGLRGARTLIAADVTVICVLGGQPAVVVGGAGEMKPVEAEVDEGLALELLARRLDIDQVAAPDQLAEELGYARLDEPGKEDEHHPRGRSRGRARRLESAPRRAGRP